MSTVGDETVAYRATVPVESDGTSLGEVCTDVILVRVGRGPAGLFFQTESRLMNVGESGLEATEATAPLLRSWLHGASVRIGADG